MMKQRLSQIFLLFAATGLLIMKYVKTLGTMNVSIYSTFFDKYGLVYDCKQVTTAEDKRDSNWGIGNLSF